MSAKFRLEAPSVPRFDGREDRLEGKFHRFEAIFLQMEGMLPQNEAIEDQNEETFPQNEAILLLFEGNSLDLREFSKKPYSQRF